MPRTGRPGAGAVRGDHVEPPYEYPVAVLPVGDEGYAQAEPFSCRSARCGVRRDRAGGAGEPGGASHPETARDHQVSAGGKAGRDTDTDAALVFY